MELMACRNCFWAVRLRNVGVRVFALVFAIGFRKVWSAFGGGWIGVRSFGDGGDVGFPRALMLRRRVCLLMFRVS